MNNTLLEDFKFHSASQKVNINLHLQRSGLVHDLLLPQQERGNPEEGTRFHVRVTARCQWLPTTGAMMSMACG